MLKFLRFMLVSMLWFNVWMQAAEAELVVKMPSFTQQDRDFVLDAYSKYQKAMATSSVDQEVEKIMIDYCNELLSRFYRSDFDKMCKESPDGSVLEEAIDVACKGIDKIGRCFLNVCAKGDISNIQIAILQYQHNGMLQIPLNAQDIYGETALTFACRKGHVAVVKELLSVKDASGNLLVDVHAKNEVGLTILQNACFNGRVAVVKELLSIRDVSGNLLVDVNAQDIYGETALIFACRKGDVAVVKELLSVKDASGNLLVDVHAKNEVGLTILQKACFVKDVEIVKILLEYGANIGHQPDDGACALGMLHHQLVSSLISDTYKAQIKKILRVFDAARPRWEILLIKMNKSEDCIAEMGKYLETLGAEERQTLIVDLEEYPEATWQQLHGQKPRAFIHEEDAYSKGQYDNKNLINIIDLLILEAYELFQKGQPQELKHLLFDSFPVLKQDFTTEQQKEKGITARMDDYLKRIALTKLDVLFKRDSIRPLFWFLIDNRKEQILANEYLEALALPPIDLPSLRPKLPQPHVTVQAQSSTVRDKKVKCCGCHVS